MRNFYAKKFFGIANQVDRFRKRFDDDFCGSNPRYFFGNKFS